MTDAEVIQKPGVPTEAALKDLDYDALRARLAEFTAAAEPLSDIADQQALLDAALAHPMWQVRHATMDLARAWLPAQHALQFVMDCTHDNVDFVAFKAIRMCGEISARDAVPHLVRISGWPSKFRSPDHLRKPVGIGAALTKSALVNIFDDKDPVTLREKESEFLAPYIAVLNRRKRKASLDGMVHVPAGPFRFGTNEKQDNLLYFNDYIPEQEIELGAYYIDAFPVTNAQYQDFLRDAEGRTDDFAHPDAPPGKSYQSAHFRDPRFNRPDAPVVGVDWYDACAYANWAGKQLATEKQWEKAARGPDALRFPWGNDWQRDNAVNLSTSFGVEVGSVDEWEEILLGFTEADPPEPLKPNGHCPGNVSGYGVRDMVGNTWEWTRTNYYTRKTMNPFFKTRRPVEFMNRPDAFAVIRGGCFTSVPQMLQAYYRGKDLITDRHCEIGFRCVVEAG